MTRYEVLMLTVPEITEDEIASIEKGLEKTVKEGKGEVISFERWGRCRLSYQVKHNDYGIYFLSRFEADTDQKMLQAVRSLFVLKFDNIVMRAVTRRLDPKKGLEYQRPETVDEIPTRDVDSFLRENKMEGLISSSDGKISDMGHTRVAGSQFESPKFESLDSALLDDVDSDDEGIA